MNHYFFVLLAKLRHLYSSNILFIVALFVFSVASVWVATASLYPMAFDEEFHVGLIRLYSAHFFPSSVQQGRELAVYGIAGADPSYLFHYLMSFPYRLIAPFLTADASIVVLRYINIAMVVSALIIFKKALQTFGVSRGISNLCIIFFTLIPIVPLVAGQVNYDSLLLLITSVTLYSAARISSSITQSAKLPVQSSWLLVISIFLGAATKYAYLPLAAGIVFFLIIVICISQRKASSVLLLLRHFLKDSSRLKLTRKIAFAALLIVSIGLCNRYVVNTVTYGNPIPSCDAVFDSDACLSYGPWQRDYYLAKNRSPSFQPLSIASYAFTHWIPGMSQRLTFAVAGPTNDYQTKMPLPYLQTVLTVITLFAAACVVFALVVQSKLRMHPLVIVTFCMTISYLTPLLITLYKSYVSTTQPVAINGRYLLPLLPFITGCLGIGVMATLKQIRLAKFAPIVATVMIGCVALSGGGIATYVLLSESSWFWNGWAKDSLPSIKAALDLITVT